MKRRRARARANGTRTTMQRLFHGLLAIGAAPLLAVGCSLRQPPPEGASGPLIYELQNCANCHGEDRAGTARGPALAGLDRNWDRASLAEYLADPRAFAERDPRLDALRESHPGEMSRYDNLTLEQRLVLADWLLAGAGDPVGGR